MAVTMMGKHLLAQDKSLSDTIISVSYQILIVCLGK